MRAVGLVAAFAVLAMPAAAAAFKVKTNRGGKCVVDPVTIVRGDQVTYGLKVRRCSTRNGVKEVASQGLAIQGRQVVSALDRKLAPPPYTNLRTSERTLPPEPGGGVLPPIIPDVPDVPLVPGLPVDVPALPELPDLPLPGGGESEADGATYTRVDYSLRLARDKGRRAKRKPEKWRKRAGCRRSSTKRANDTLICQSFAPTS